MAWNVVPTLTANSTEQTAQLDFVCQQVTSAIDGYLHQPLRATAVTEQVQFPGHPRASMDRNTGIVTLLTRQWPVISVDAVQVSDARAFPPSYSLVPAQQSRISAPVLMPASGQPVTGPSGGNAVDIAPGAIGGGRGTGHGRGHWLISYSTTPGYPHTQTTSVVQAAAQTLAVDDVTGWAGWTGWILDGPSTESVTVTAVSAATPVQLPGVAGTVQAGPGTLTLAAALQYQHQPGALVTAIPLDALHAAALKAAVMALETLTSIAAQSSNGQVPGGLGALAFEAEAALDPFARIM